MPLTGLAVAAILSCDVSTTRESEVDRKGLEHEEVFWGVRDILDGLELKNF
jgi:hypothetical protein